MLKPTTIIAQKKSLSIPSEVRIIMVFSDGSEIFSALGCASPKAVPLTPVKGWLTAKSQQRRLPGGGAKSPGGLQNEKDRSIRIRLYRNDRSHLRKSSITVRKGR